jgi:hypothetical protein
VTADNRAITGEVIVIYCTGPIGTLLRGPFGLNFAGIAPERKLAVSYGGCAVGRMRDWLLENLLVCHTASFLNRTRNRDPYPPS